MNLLPKYYFFLFLLLIWSPFQAPAQKYFQPLKGPDGGIVVDLLQVSDEEVYAVCYRGNIFKTTDRGLTWMPTDAGEYCSAIANMHVNSKGNLFIVQGQYANIVNLLRSTDHGESWESVSDFEVFSISISPEDFIYARTWDGLFLTRNSGDLWVHLSDRRIHDLLFLNNGRIVGLEYNSDIVVSDDGGRTWVLKRDSLGGRLPYDKSPIALLKNGNILYGGEVGYSSGRVNFIVSTDNGETWIEANKGKGFGVEARYRFILPKDDTTVYTASKNMLYKTTDGGFSWRKCPDDLENGNSFNDGVVFRDGSLLCATDKGIYFLEKEGAGWEVRNNGLTGQWVYDVIVDGNDIFCGTRQGFYISRDMGNTWKVDPIFSGMKVYAMAINQNGKLIISADDYNEKSHFGIFASSDKGKSWLRLDPIKTYYYAEKISYDSDGGIYVLMGLLYRSTNGGYTWEAISKNISVDNIYDFCIDSENHIYVVQDSMVFKTTDFGSTWYDMSGNIDNKFLNAITINRNYIFVGSRSSHFGNGVTRSSNWGRTWEIVNDGLFNRNISLLSSYGNSVFLGALEVDKGSFGAVYRSTNSGKYWKNISRGVTSRWVTSMAFDHYGYMYVGTQGGSIFKSLAPMFDVSRVERPAYRSFRLYQSFPNPFGSSSVNSTNMAQIRFYLDRRSHAQIRLFDVLGREVMKIVEGEFDAGLYEARLDATNLESGTYFYVLSTESDYQIKSMTYLK